MIRRQPVLITLVSEETVCFLKLSTDGCFQTLASLPLADFLEGGEEAADLPKAVLQSVNRLLVLPDYWMGSRFDEFQARKTSVITAFIERKLKLEQPTLTQAGDFYHYAVVRIRTAASSYTRFICRRTSPIGSIDGWRPLASARCA